MDRRRFVGTGAGLLVGFVGRGAGRDPLALLQQQDGGDETFQAFLESLRSALGDTDASVVDGASALGYGVVLLTTGAEEPGDEAFDSELEAVADAYLGHVEGQAEPLAVGLLVEAYRTAEAAEARGDAFATYAVTTAAAREAIETGESGSYHSQVRSTVSPPVWAAEEGDGAPAVELRDHELRNVASEVIGVDETPTVEATVVNGGNARSRTVELVVDWYDGEGAFLQSDTARLQTLRPGETWLARAYPATVSDRGRIDDYEATVLFDDPQYATPEGLAVAESELSVGGEARLSGALENGTGESLAYVEAIGRVLDAEGRVLGDDWTNDTEVEAGATVRFTLRYRDEDRVRLDAIDGYEVLPLGRA